MWKTQQVLNCFLICCLLTESHSGLKIFTGNSNKPLAQDIVNQLGLSLGKITVNQFADGEVNVMVNENVRGKDVYIIQPTSPPVNETLMELLLMISTMRRASARKITAVIPYYGYARQDRWVGGNTPHEATGWMVTNNMPLSLHPCRKMQARVPISAADVARLLEAMGVDRVVAVDLHCGQIQGFFGPRVPGIELSWRTMCRMCHVYVLCLVVECSSSLLVVLFLLFQWTILTEAMLA